MEKAGFSFRYNPNGDKVLGIKIVMPDPDYSKMKMSKLQPLIDQAARMLTDSSLSREEHNKWMDRYRTLSNARDKQLGLIPRI